MKKLLNFAVLAVIAGSLAVVSCTPEVKTSDFEALKTEVENLKNQLKASEVDLKTQINTLQFVLQSYKDEVTPQLAKLNEEVKADYAILAEADILLGQKLEEAQNALQAAINQNSKDIAANKKALQDAIAEYKKLVADAIKDFQAALAKAIEDQAATDSVQDLALIALAEQVQAYKDATDKAIESLGTTVEELAATIEDMQGSMEDMSDAIEKLGMDVEANFAAAIAYTDALEASVKATTDALAKRIEANEAAIKKLNEETIPEIAEALLALQTSVKDLEGNTAALEEKKLDKEVFVAFLTGYAEWATRVGNDIDGINDTIEELKQFDATIESQVEAIEEILEVLDGDETVEGSVKQQIKALHEDVLEHLGELKDEIEEQIAGLEEQLAGVQEDIDAINADIVLIKGEINSLNDELIDVNGKITAAEGDIAALQTAKTELEKKIAALEKALADQETELKSLISDLSDQIDIIKGDENTEGSIKYAVAQLSAAINTQIDILTGRIADNEEAIEKLQKEIGKLQKRIQSLVFVPQYQDLKFGIPFTKIGNTYKAYNTVQGFPVVYKVAPVELAKHLAKAVNDAIAAGVEPVFTFDIESGLKTRAGENDPKLIIKEAVGDEATGKITLYLAHMNFEPQDVAGQELGNYAISLRVDNDDYEVHVASEFVQAKLHQKAELTVIETALYKPDVTTGKAGEFITINNDPDVVEGTLGLCYADGKAYSYFDGYELAAKDEHGVIRTFSQFKAMGYDMPTVTTTVTPVGAPETTNIVANPTAKPATFAVKIMDGLKDNMVVTKTEIDKTNRYNYEFNYGASTKVNAQLDVKIVKYTGTFQVNFPYTMNWTYALINDPSTNSDDEVDHANKNADPAIWKAYHRGTDALEETFVVTPTLTVDGQDLVLDGSNKVYGLTVEDFADKTFTPSVASPFPGEIFYNFTVAKRDVDKKTISLTQFDVKGVRLGKTYTCAGSYDLNAYTTENVKAAFTITTVDRKTDVIKITAPAVNVKLLGDEYDKDKDRYAITSDDFAQALVDAYIAQGILPAGTVKAHAFAANEEFGEINIVDDASSDLDDNFTFDVVYTDPNEAFKIKSKGDLLKSKILHQVASNYEKKPWALTVETYVGQKIQITWPISAAPKYDYKFVTYGINTADNSFQVPVEWVGEPTTITKAKTELDLVKNNDYNIKVMYLNGALEDYVAFGDYGKDDFKLVPRFSLVEVKDGIDIDNSGTAALECVSNVKYYGQPASVGVKSALYVKSGDTEFYVPGSDKMYVNGTPVTSVTVKQVNPIAAVQANPTEPVNIVSGVAQTPVKLTMKDIQGFSLYADGAAQNNHSPYADLIKTIFNSVIFSIYSVDQSTAIAGWALEGASEFGTVDTPPSVQLKTSGVAKGTYKVMLKAKTAWKDYFYEVTVNNQ